MLHCAMTVFTYVILTLNIQIFAMKFCLVTTKAKPKVSDNCTMHSYSRAYN